MSKHLPVQQMDEIWRSIPGYEGKYEASNLGSIRSYWGRTLPSPNILVQMKDKDGYPRVTLSFPAGGQKRESVHRLVLIAFVGLDGERRECRHLNGIRDDNRLDNLKWGPYRENRGDMILHGTHRKGEMNNAAKLREEDVRYIRANPDMSHAELGRRFGVSSRAIIFVRLGKTWRHVK